MPTELEHLKARLTEEELARYQEMNAQLPRPPWYHSSSDDDSSRISSLEDDEAVKTCC